MPGWTGSSSRSCSRADRSSKPGNLYLLDQRTFNAEVQKAQAAEKAEADLQYAKEGGVFRAESRLAQSRAALIKTEQDVARYTPLVKEQAASQQDLDAAVAQRDVAQQEVEARKTELTQTKLTSAPRSPWPLPNSKRHGPPCAWQSSIWGTPASRPGGRPYRRVERLCRHPGDKKLAQASDAVPLDPIQVKVKIGERTIHLYPHLEWGSRGEKEATGDVVSLSASSWVMAVPIPTMAASGQGSAVDPQTGTLEITLDFPNPQAMLLPGIFSRVKIQTEKSGVFLVPQRAITELQGVRTVSGRPRGNG